MSYQPFLIAPFATGLDTDQAPWLLPQDAFRKIENAHIYHGVIEKRSGSKEWAKMTQTTTNLLISSISSADPGVVTVTSTAALSNSDLIQINYVSGMTEVNGVTYIVSGLTPTTFALTDTEGVNVDTSAFTAYASGGTVSTFPVSRIMGINQWVDNSNNKDVLVFNKTRAAKYDGTNNSLEPLDSVDIMSGGDDDFIVSSDWASSSGSTATTLNRIYFTNGVSNSGTTLDGIRYYQSNSGSPPVTTQYNPLINSSTEIRGCKLIFAMGQRLLLLHTFEGGKIFAQRVRWCQIQNPDDATAWDDNKSGKGGFVDCPTGDQIISAQFLKDNLIVFFTNSVWMLSRSPDPSLPFRWIRINNWRAIDGKMASVGFDRNVMSMGIRGISSTDGVDTQRIDDRIEDFVRDEVNQGEFSKVFAKRSYGDRRLWWLYPQEDESQSNNALIYDEASKAYSTYLIPLNVLGDGTSERDYTWNDFPSSADSPNRYDLPLTFDDPELDGATWQSYHFDKGSELLLGGDFSGVVHEMNFGATDNGANIPVRLDSASWNPWTSEGKKAQFGYLDIFVDSSKDMLLTLDFYKDNDRDPYLTKVVDLLPDIGQLVNIIDIVIKSDPTEGVRVSAPNHGIPDGSPIYIYGVQGMSQINGGSYTVVLVDNEPNVFDIVIDATTFSAYTQNGIVSEREYLNSKIWKRIHVGATGYQHYVSIVTQEMNSALRIHAFMPWLKPSGSRLI